MSDRELLEMAAKAANQERSVAGDLWSNARGALWNPLTDDGDALRLAVKLGIDMIHFHGHLRADVGGMPDVHQLHNGDPYAATRRAITRAAAEIGKAMP